MPSTGSLSSLLTGWFGQLVAAIVGIAAVYKFFIEFVEADEMAVRARNNKIDYYHEKMSWPRRILTIVGIGGLVATIVLIIRFGTDSWFIWTGVALSSILLLWRTISTWPRTDIPALVGPGFKLKVPGWISYKRAKAATNTRTVHIEDRIDASGNLVNVDVTYVWARGTLEMTRLWQARAKVVKLIHKEGDAITLAATCLWRSMFGVDNLEESLDGIVRESALKTIGETEHMTHLGAEGLSAFCASVIVDASSAFQHDFGSTLHVTRLGRTGPPAQVTAMSQIAKAIEAHPDLSTIFDRERS